MPAEAPRRSDARRNRERIVAAAAACFAREGLDCQVAQVAREAGVGNATVFRHFATKDDLLLAVVEEKMEEMAGVLRAAEAEPDPYDGVRHALDEMCRMHTADLALRQLAAEFFTGQPSLLAARDAMIARFDALLRRAKAAGAVRPDVGVVDLVVLANAVSLATAGFEHSQPRLYRRYLELALAGLRPDAPTLPHPAPTPDELDEAWRRTVTLSRR